MPIRLVELREDAHRQELRLENVDAPVAPRQKRVVALGVVLLLLAAVAVIEYFVLEAGAFVPNVLFLLALGGIAAAILLVRLKRLLSLTVKCREGRLTFARGIPGQPPPETTEVSCALVESVGLAVRHGAKRGSRLTMPFHLTVRGEPGRVLLAEPVFAAGLNQDHELLDLVVRLGHAIGLSHYHVALRDPRRFEVRATRVPEERSRPIPSSIDEPADYGADRVMPGLVLPDRVLASFDPSTPLPKGLRITRWEPGRSIAIAPRRALLRWVGGLASAAAAAACIWGWWHPERLPFWRDDAWVWLVVAAGPAVIGWHLVRSGLFRARLDLAARAGDVRHGLARQRIALSQITEVVLSRHVRWGTVSTEARRGSNTFYTYGLELRGNDAEALPLLPAITTHMDDRERTCFDVLYPLSIALATELGRPHRYVETEESPRG